MRVVAGSARSIVLETPAGNTTRPTTDRIKETLFNILMPYLNCATVLDLFAGSGGLAIEALSRGASFATIVDQSRQAIECIKKNVNKTKFTDKSEVLAMDYAQALAMAKRQGRKYDLVLLDPPYNKGLELEALRLLKDLDLLDEAALIVVEMSLEDSDANIEAIERMGIYSVKKLKTYKSNLHLFLELA